MTNAFGLPEDFDSEYLGPLTAALFNDKWNSGGNSEINRRKNVAMQRRDKRGRLAWQGGRGFWKALLNGVATNFVGIGYIRPDGIGNVDGTYPAHNSPYGNNGIGITQTIPTVGALSFYYAPNSSSIAANDILNSFKSTQVEAGNNAMSELVFKGDFGVKGLNVLLGRQFNDAPDAQTTTTFKAKDGSHYSASYNFGSLTVGVERKTQEGSDTNGAATNSEKRTGKCAGLAYAVTKDLSLGLTYADASTDVGTSAAPRPDEIVKIIALGYNLGPVAVQAQYKDVENASSVAANDGSIFAVRVSTAF
jgi:hypothetical protein